MPKKWKVTSKKGALGESVGRVRMGPRSNPDLAFAVGDTVELTEEQEAQLRASGFRLKEVGEDTETTEEKEAGGEVESKADQQRAQVASGAMAPPASPETDNTPGGRQTRAGK